MMTHPVLVAAIRAKVSQAASTVAWPPYDKSSTIVRRFGMAGNPAVHRPLGEAAAADVRDRFSQEATMPELASVFTDLVNQSNGR